MTDSARPDGPAADPRHLLVIGAGTGAPGVLVYNASMLTPDSLLSSDVAHLHQAYDVDVAGAIVATQVAAPAMRAAGGGTILFTGGGWAASTEHEPPVLSHHLARTAVSSRGQLAGRMAAPCVVGPAVRGKHVT
jgi:NAD(P)-dependent dehydrogenase (short-subunit alcohol dehydrogenase family)